MDTILDAAAANRNAPRIAASAGAEALRQFGQSPGLHAVEDPTGTGVPAGIKGSAMCRPFSFALATVLLACGALAAQAPHVVTAESTVTATVDRIEKGPRTLGLRAGDQYQTVYVDPSVKEFDDLHTGDTVTVRYVESVIVQVRPNAALSAARDTTEEARKAGRTDVVLQQKAVVTIENIDSQGLFVSYRTGGGMHGVRGVTDERLLEGLHVGDRVEITLTRERAVSIQRRK